jgi:hypothetical protein
MQLFFIWVMWVIWSSRNKDTRGEIKYQQIKSMLIEWRELTVKLVQHIREMQVRVLIPGI